MSVASFKPELWASSLDVSYQDNLVYAQTGVANTRFQPILQNSGKSVTINRIGAGQTRPYDPAVPITYDTLSTTKVDLVMDEQEYYAFLVDDVDKAQAAGDFQGAGTEQHGIAMAAKVDSTVSTKLRDGAGKKIGNTAIFNGADFYMPASGQATAWDALRMLSKELNKVSAPSLNRWVVVGPEFGDALLADRHLTEADKAGTDAVARNGLIATIKTLGFSVFTSNSVPVTAGRELIIGGAPNALDFASQLQTTEAFRHQDHIADAVRGLQVWGSVVSNPKGVVTLEADVQPGVLPSAQDTTPTP
ncbi:phage capsid protein [Corynebacterium glutamicum]|uniref:phage capsid protein n=1 Tax=Corynebacterium glutamicum TaxID=1718 RepID=UPI0005C4CEDB|nr:phage capsid protein [Corynebacterium glutamicum]